MKKTPEFYQTLSLEFSQLAADKNKHSDKIYSLGLGEPDFDTPVEIIDAAYASLRKNTARYSSPFGILELRKKISQMYSPGTGVENVIITSGAKQALSFVLMSILDPEDEIINITPSYVSYVPQIKMAEPEVKIINVDMQDSNFELNIDSIRNKLTNKTKAILINSPHNPTGKMLSKNEVSQLLELAKEHGVYVINDEIYGQLNFSRKEHYSFRRSSVDNEFAITINGFSKAYSMTGWRIGYVVADSSIIKTISKIVQNMNTNTPTFVQEGAIAALEINKKFLKDYNHRLEENYKTLFRVLSPNPKIKIIPSDGGLFVFLDISKTELTSDNFSYLLLKNKSVATTPGVVFSSKFDKFIRVSLSIESNDFSKSVDLISEFINEL